MRRKFFLFLCLILIFYFLSTSVVIVKESQNVVVTRFGQPVRTFTEAGPALKWPDPFEVSHPLDIRIRLYDPEPLEMMTSDKKNLVVDTFLIWSIEDPVKFLRTVGSTLVAEQNLHDLLRHQVGVVVGQEPLDAFLSLNPDQVRTKDLMQSVTEQCNRYTTEAYGITVSSAQIKRLTLPPANLASVYSRMRSERERIARQYRSEGEEEALVIRAQTDQEVASLLSESRREALVIRGQADAEALRITSTAYSRHPDFYRFQRTLAGYEQILDEKTTLVLSTRSDLFRLLNSEGAR